MTQPIAPEIRQSDFMYMRHACAPSRQPRIVVIVLVGTGTIMNDQLVDAVQPLGRRLCPAHIR